MSKRLIGVVGFFGNGISTAGGQEAKTCALTRLLQTYYGEKSICTVDTNNWKKNPLKLFLKVCRLAASNENVIMLPAQNSVRVFAPLFVLLRAFCRCKVHYAVVGGWLPKLSEEKRITAWFLKKLDGIYVETQSMHNALEAQGYANVAILPNFKFIEPICVEAMPTQYDRPLQVCTFSRVVREKGIEDAVEALRQINEEFEKTVICLDIYGKIDPRYEEVFAQIMEKAPSYIRYCGMVEPEQSVEILKKYTALLFPTHYATEGVPGTIIDAYAAGVPIITALWDNSEDVFEEGVTGWGYRMGDQSAFVSLLRKLVTEPEAFMAMKQTARMHYEKYRPESVMPIIDRMLGRVAEN